MEKSISDGTSCFLVSDDSLLQGWDAPFIEFLTNEGFESWKTKGYFTGTDWIYVNINSKIYAFGMPGVRITTPIGKHAITLDEFMTIYNIYKKYDINHPLVMTYKK